MKECDDHSISIVKDPSDNNTIKKKMIFNLPLRMLLIGKTGSGKTSCLVSMLLKNGFYGNDFDGENMFIFSPMQSDYKMETLIKRKKIPLVNVYTDFDDDLLNGLYDLLAEKAKLELALDTKIKSKLIVLDDLSFTGALAKGRFNAVSRVFCNGRKLNISIIVTSQFYKHILPVCRSNASAVIAYNCSNSDLDALQEDHNYLTNKREFKKLFRDNVKEKHDFMAVNYSNSRDEGLYLNTKFKKIG